MTRRLTGLLALLIIVPGCAELTQVLQAAFQKPRLTFKTARLSNVAFDSLTLDTVWLLENPNAIGISLARSDYKLSIEGKQVVAGAPPHGLNIPAGGTTELVFPASIKFADLFPLASDLANREFAKYRVEGVVGVQTPIGVLDFPLSYENQFEVPKVPKVELQPPRITKLSFQGTTVEFPIAITNKNSFALPLSGVTGALSVAGHEVGKVNTPDLGRLEGKGTRVVSIPLQFDLINGASAVVAAVQGGTANVGLSAKLQAGNSSVPIDVSQVLKFVR
ncbi:MAG: LEA type 2 family protein [Archangiaceae bacterium]|nr:LEA type 2 family protein [Archangiaceae bacterium]